MSDEKELDRMKAVNLLMEEKRKNLEFAQKYLEGQEFLAYVKRYFGRLAYVFARCLQWRIKKG